MSANSFTKIKPLYSEEANDAYIDSAPSAPDGIRAIMENIVLENTQRKAEIGSIEIHETNLCQTN